MGSRDLQSLNRNVFKRKEEHGAPQILIVEDSELDRGLLGDVLEDLGEITFAPTGQEALNCLNKKDFDLVLLGVMLPDMNGFDLCKKIRESKCDDHLPIIILTSLDDPDSERQGLVAGASDYVRKPYAPMVVKTRVESQIKRYRTSNKTNDDSRAPAENKWALDCRRNRLTTPEGVEHTLTDNEFLLLNLLCKSAGEPVGKDEILTGLGKDFCYVGEGSLHTLMSRLRKKINTESTTVPIRAVRNIGYSFYEDVVMENAS